MPVPTQESIQQSLLRLKKSLPLFQQDIRHIAWAFAFLPHQDRLLKEIHAHNPKLAESLLIFRKRLRDASADAALESVIDHLFLHYVINTDGPIPEQEEEDFFDVFDAAVRYARTLCVGVSKGQHEDAILRLNGKEVVCRGWGPVLGTSAAWSLRQIGKEVNKARYGRNDVIPPVAFGFDEQGGDYRLQNAMTLADFSHMAYFEPTYVEELVRQWGYSAFHWIDDAGTDTQAFVTGKENHVVVCFRGTSSGKDALADVNFFKTEAFGGRGQVHRGFQQSLDSVWAKVQSAVNAHGANKKIFVCGHSLGAALAQLAAHRLALSNYPVAGVYVFGSPRVGNREFREVYNALLEEITFLHINHLDIVTQLPPQLFGFQHLGGPPRLFDIGHFMRRDDTMEENTGNEQRFEDLDTTTQEAIRQSMEAVQTSIKASTQFLDTSPQEFSGASYGTEFETGVVDDHGMDQYIFKFGCAIVDGEWQRLEQTKGAD
ncbi:MAG: lipase family protein [Saprospiraceae bacterium]|nr:lipase family protein [Saprospiraceae bacterium]